MGDFDGDGRLELLVSHGESTAQPLSLYRPRLGATNHWLRVAPLTVFGAPARGAVVRPSIHPPINPPYHPSMHVHSLPHFLTHFHLYPPPHPHQVRLTAAGRTQLRVIDSGSGYLCQMEPVAHFGLGGLTEARNTTYACHILVHAHVCMHMHMHMLHVWDAIMHGTMHGIMHCTMHCTMHRTLHRTLHCPLLQGGCDRGRVARWRVCGAERERDDRHPAHRGLPRRQRR